MMYSAWIGFQRASRCPDREITIANSILAAINALIAIAAFSQLLRLYLYTLPLRWTRQKVFHCLIGVASLGYCLYFVLNVIAPCQGWYCWKHACGFIAMAVPQILFLATFLLLLSFWVDLCHQATDKEEEEDDEEETDGAQAQATVGKDPKVPVHTDKHRRCCHWWRSRIHGRQKFVIAVVMLIFMITLVCAILIWIGMGDNFIDSGTVAEIYSDMLAIVIFLSGGGLAGYGLALYTRMSRLRVGKTSAELQKVAGLAVVSVLCFSIRALFILLGVFKIRSRYTSVVFFLYSFIGEVIPCVVVLWVMRNNPSRLSSTQSRRSVTSVSGYQQALAQEQALLQQWIVPDDMESIIVASSRSRRSKSGRVADSSEGSTSNSG
ncbi:tobamovirus multiplication protein 1 [Selaginella moellendorffii]|uniref:tobamovirus multiplication protein 1 n=1 Tax=Selaginella moellendorffii TaxID=88036 RepID=UPI000D1CE54C|nr:tobamovirus multiplication protein 1 [Selaginella moellendorffii]|eukprot:XP_024537139.1 tobamovirus multiplication protein 1 [Selaginella moellendorffii]